MNELNTYGGPVVDSGVPKTMTATMPSMTMTAQAAATHPVQPPALTPAYLLEKLPSIIEPAPINVAPCDTFAQWVSDNGILVGVGMALLAWFVWKEHVR